MLERQVTRQMQQFRRLKCTSKHTHTHIVRRAAPAHLDSPRCLSGAARLCFFYRSPRSGKSTEGDFAETIEKKKKKFTLSPLARGQRLQEREKVLPEAPVVRQEPLEGLQLFLAGVLRQRKQAKRQRRGGSSRSAHFVHTHDACSEIVLGAVYRIKCLLTYCYMM